ncbi:response regulator transcription factor [Paenibacillus sinopodophylli]|uniref:response regulator transcription factor n=1 Tax=Paenibacillus sinopodophylli TaxID=1837342 RepID=UPI00110CCC53|nr:response regulator transcription factor [Paenibacillus sinopodophylli]
MHMYRAVLVDDESFTRKGLMKLIDWEACGFQVAGEADNGEDAFELIKREQPDLVITDIRMPVIDGLELIKLISLENMIQPSFIIISGYNDFKYAQQAMRYGVHDFVVKPIDEIEFTAILQSLNNKLKHEREEQLEKERLRGVELIKSLILGEAADVVIAEWEVRLQISKGDDVAYVFAELNDTHSWQQSGNATSNTRFKEKLEAELIRITAAEQPICMHEHRNRIGMLVPSELLKPFQGELEHFLVKLRDALDVHFGRGVFLYAGTRVSRLSDIRESYKAAKEALLYKYIHEDKRIVVYDQIRLEPLHYISFEPALFHEFMEQFEELKLDSVHTKVEHWFRDFRDKRYAPEAIKMNLQQCVMGILKTIRSMEGEELTLSTLQPLLNWHDNNLSLGELHRLFTAFIEESQNYVAELRKEQQKGGINKIKSYIELHFSHNISLKSIAAIFYINPVYLGQLFKKTYGVYFNEFLLQLRVSEAKKLLRQSSTIRIYEIAEKVGFSNADYFVTQFEKLEHMTPTEYRNQLK